LTTVINVLKILKIKALVLGLRKGCRFAYLPVRQPKAGAFLLQNEGIQAVERIRTIFDLKEAPRDGRKMLLISKNGDKHIGYWGQKTKFTVGLGWNTSQEAWLNDDEKFIDSPFNPIVGWEILPRY